MSKQTLIKNLSKLKTRSKLQKLDAQAATLIAFCNVAPHNTKSILFMTRPEKMSYGGNVCFPGGKMDKGIDKNFTETALREANEEVGLKSENVEVWGSIPGIPDKFGKMCVTGIVGQIVGEGDMFDTNDLVLSEDEVDQVFTVPVDHLLDGTNLSIREYKRGGIDKPVKLPSYAISQVKPDIWGLTAIQLNIVLNQMYGAKSYLEL